MLQGRKGKGMCAVLLMLVMCFGPVPAEAQAEGAPPDSARRYTVEYTVNGTRWPDWTFTIQAESAAQALAAAPDHLGELGGDYEKLPQPQAEGTVLTVAYRTKVRLASALVVKSDYYNGDGALAGTVVQEYEAPAGERAVIDSLEGSLEGIEYIPVRLVLQATPFADSDSTDETRLALTDNICCGEGVHYLLLVRFEQRQPGQEGQVACKNDALQAMASSAAQVEMQPAAHPVQVTAGGVFQA